MSYAELKQEIDDLHLDEISDKTTLEDLLSKEGEIIYKIEESFESGFINENEHDFLLAYQGS